MKVKETVPSKIDEIRFDHEDSGANTVSVYDSGVILISKEGVGNGHGATIRLEGEDAVKFVKFIKTIKL